MEWLSQNWIWLALAVGVVLLFSRGRHGAMGGGCCDHEMAREGPAGEGKARGTDVVQSVSTQGKPAQAAQGGAPASQHHGHGGCH